MRKLFYGGAHVVISDQTCKAILRYARALAKAGSSDIIVFPALSNENRVGMAHALIGPASQLLSVPTEHLDLDLDDPRMVEVLESRTKNLDPTTPDWDKDVLDVQDFSTFDWDY